MLKLLDIKLTSKQFLQKIFRATLLKISLFQLF